MCRWSLGKTLHVQRQALPTCAGASDNTALCEVVAVISGSSARQKMTHPIYRVRSFEINAPYTLRVQFDDGTEQTIDFQPMLAGEMYGPLRDLAVFNQVRIDPEVRTLVWPNGADFDPATLHDWPERESALIARAKQWDLTAT